MNKKRFYVTTPIFYPSGSLHIGHLYTATIAETLRNYKKMMGYETLFLTGSDEHGEKIEAKAKEVGKTPQEYVDKMCNLNKSLWRKLDINYDIYMRTTNMNHKKTVQKIFSNLLQQDVIYKSKYRGLYSVQDEEFFTKTQAVKKEGVYYSPISNHPLKTIEEESYFFRMNRFEEFLKKYFIENPTFIIPKKIVNELVKNFLDKGLADLSITRTSFKWGIPIKEDPKHIIYVWLDALCNYVTALGYIQEKDEKMKLFWENKNAQTLHIVGKEITRFHCIYWPIILKTLNLKMPTNILSHGWIVTKSGKMSKSKGNVIDPLEIVKTWSPEVVKYYLVTKIPMGEDGTFDLEHLKNVYNADLVNNFGNLVSRTIAMVIKNCGNVAPCYQTTNSKTDQIMQEKIISTFQDYSNNMDHFNIPKAFQKVMALSKSLNKYIDVTMPWTLKLDESHQLESILNTLLNGIYAVSAMLSPIITKKTKIVLEQISFKNFDFNRIGDFKKFDKKEIIKTEIIFKRVK